MSVLPYFEKAGKTARVDVTRRSAGFMYIWELLQLISGRHHQNRHPCRGGLT